MEEKSEQLPIDQELTRAEKEMYRSSAVIFTRRRPLTPQESAAKDRLAEIWATKKHSLGLSQRKAADLVGMTQSGILHYLKGRNGLSLEAVLRFAKLLDVSPRQIYPEIIAEQIDGVSGLGLHLTQRTVPLIAWNQVAKLAQGDSYTKLADLPCPIVPAPPELFALEVIGDRMAPDYKEGDTIFVDPSRLPRHGDDAIGNDNAGSAYFSRIQLLPEGAFLSAANPRYPVVPMSNKLKAQLDTGSTPFLHASGIDSSGAERFVGVVVYSGRRHT